MDYTKRGHRTTRVGKQNILTSFKVFAPQTEDVESQRAKLLFSETRLPLPGFASLHKSTRLYFPTAPTVPAKLPTKTVTQKDGRGRGGVHLTPHARIKNSRT